MHELPTIFDLIINLALSGTRMGVALYAVPFIHQSVVVPMVRNTVVLAFSIPILPLVMSYHLVQGEIMFFIWVLIAKEVFLGVIIGFTIGIIFWAAQCAGNLIDMQRGAFFAIMIDPLSKSDTTPLGNLLFQLATILFFICGGFREMIGALIESYHVWPVHRYFPQIDQSLAVFIAHMFTRCLKLAVIIAAPIVISAFLADLALGILNRLAPQVNVFMISLPVKSTIVSIVLILYISFLLKYLHGHFMDSEAILNIVREVFQ